MVEYVFPFFLHPFHYVNFYLLFLCCNETFAKLLCAITTIHFDLWRHQVRELTLEIVKAMTIHNLSFFFLYPCCYAIFGLLFLSCDLWDFCWIRESTLEIVDLCIFVATWSTVYCFWLWFVWQHWVRESFLKIVTVMAIHNLCFLPPQSWWC